MALVADVQSVAAALGMSTATMVGMAAFAAAVVDTVWPGAEPTSPRGRRRSAPASWADDVSRVLWSFCPAGVSQKLYPETCPPHVGHLSDHPFEPQCP